MQWLNSLLNILLVFASLILIFLVLIQRGKGGGLAGAFGGVGGSSAFGTKAGDVFTKITMYVAGVWIVLSMVLVLLVNQGRTSAWGESPSATQKVPATAGGTKADAGANPASAGKTAEVEPSPPGSGPAEKEGPARPLNPGDPTPVLPPAIPPAEKVNP